MEGIGEIEALIDTGGVCLIQKDFLSQSILSKTTNSSSSCSSCYLINGTKVENNLGCVNLAVTILGSTVSVPFYITDQVVGNFIVLGVSWMLKMGIVLESDGSRFWLSLGGKKNEMESKEPPCPISPVTLGGIGLVKTIVDTGAGFSAIRADTLTDNVISSMIPTSITVLASNGSVANVLGCVSLYVTYLGTTSLLENVCVLSEMPVPFILGVGWIHETRVVIYSDGSNIVVHQPNR